MKEGVSKSGDIEADENSGRRNNVSVSSPRINCLISSDARRALRHRRSSSRSLNLRRAAGSLLPPAAK